MKHLTSTFIIFLLSFSAAFAQQVPSKEFNDLLKRTKMTLTMPSLYEIIPNHSNPHMDYELAIDYPLDELEVRYAIRPLDWYIKSYKQYLRRKNPNELMAKPNDLYESLFIATVANISGEFPEYQAFPSSSVKKEFNADWGATVFVEVRPEFGLKYKYCLVVAIHKDDLGDAYIFFMANDNQVITRHLLTAFHSLRFK